MCCKSTLGTILVFILFHFSTCIDTDKELFEKFECSKNNGCVKPLYQGRVITQYNNLPVSTTVQVYAKKGEYILVKTEKGKLVSVKSSFVQRFGKSLKNGEKNKMPSNNANNSPTPTNMQNFDTSTISIQPSQMDVQPGTFDHSTNGPEEYNDGPGIEESEDPDDISIKDEDGNDYISSDLVLSTGGSLNQNVPSSDNFKTNVQNTQSKTQFPDGPNGSKEKMTATTTATYSSQSPTVDLSDHNAVNQGNENSEKPGMSIKENGTSANSAIPGQGIDTNPENPANSDQRNAMKSNKSAISSQGNDGKSAEPPIRNPENATKSDKPTSGLENESKSAEPSITNQDNKTESLVHVSSANSTNATDQGIELQPTKPKTIVNSTQVKEDAQSTEHAVVSSGEKNSQVEEPQSSEPIPDASTKNVTEAKEKTENGTSANSAIPGQGIDTNPENPANSDQKNAKNSNKSAISSQGNDIKSAEPPISDPENATISGLKNETKSAEPSITNQDNKTESLVHVSSANSTNATDQGIEIESTKPKSIVNSTQVKEDAQSTEHAVVSSAEKISQVEEPQSSEPIPDAPTNNVMEAKVNGPKIEPVTNESSTKNVGQTKGTPELLNETQSSGSAANTKSTENKDNTQETPEPTTDASSTSQEPETPVTNIRSINVNFTEVVGQKETPESEKTLANASSIENASKEKEIRVSASIDTSIKTEDQTKDTPKLGTNTGRELSTTNTSSTHTSNLGNETQPSETAAKIENTETVNKQIDKLAIKTTSAENIDQENGTLSEDPITEKTIDIHEKIKHSRDQIYRPPTLPYHMAHKEIQHRYGADQPTMGKHIGEQSSIEKTDEKLINLDSQIDGVTKETQTSDENLPNPTQQKSSDTLSTHLTLETKDNIVGKNEISKDVNSNGEQLSTGISEKSYFTETYNNLNLDILSDYISSNEIFKDYPSSVIFLNTVLFLLLLLLLNCLSVRKCDNVIKGKLYMCEKKLLEHNAETYKIQEMLEDQNENSEHFKKLQNENEVQKSNVNMLTKRINDLEENEIALKESLSEFKSKYETLEEVSSKKNIKKNYEKLMDQVKVQKNKLDELAANMEERAEVLRKEKENIESLLKVQAEEHNKVVNDYKMLLNNVELENKELREIIQTMSVDSDTSEKLLEAVKLQVQLSDMEKECQNLHHQLEGEREAHKLLEDHQRMTQKEVNDLRESCEIAIKEKADISNKLKYITDYFQQLEDKLKKEIADKDDLINEKLGDDDSLAKALMNLRKENCVLNEENNILRVKYDSLKVELTDQKNEEKIAKTKLESEREQIWMDWRAAERKIESLNLDNKVLRSKLVALGSKSETSFRDMHTQTYDDPDKMLSPTSSLFLDHTSPVPQPSYFIPSYAIPPPPLSDDEMRQMYGSNRNYNENGYHTDEDHEHSYDHRLPPLGGTFSPPTLDNIPVPNIPPPLDNEELWKRQTWNSQDVSSNEDEPSTLHNSYSRRRTGDSVSSVSSSKRSFV